MELFKKEYNGENIVDIFRDVSEAFNAYFNPPAGEIPKDEYGFQQGSFVVTVDWNNPAPEHENFPLPDWVERRSDGTYMELGAQLTTRDGRRTGNAYVDSIEAHPSLGQLAVVNTDMGNTFRMTATELEDAFYPPAYVMRIDEARQKRISMDCHKFKNDLTEIVAGALQYFEFMDRNPQSPTFDELTRATTGSIDRYRNDYVFHAKVNSLVSRITIMPQFNFV